MTLIMDRIAELERAAETSRAEHAAALKRAEELEARLVDRETKCTEWARTAGEHAAAIGLATARIRELEGERDELLGLLRMWTTVPGVFLTPREHFDQPGDYGGCLCPLHEARAIVARIEKAAKGATK